MGSSSSSSQNATTNEAAINLTTRLTEVETQFLCKIQVGENIMGTGFLCSVVVNETTVIRGLFTNNHLVPGSELLPEFEISFEFLNAALRVKADEDVVYFFSCALLDATFIVLKPAITNGLLSKARFLKAASMSPPIGSLLCVVQNHLGEEDALLTGILLEYWGFDIRHTASTHMKYVLSAIVKDYSRFTSLPPRIHRHLTIDDKSELLRVVKLMAQGTSDCSFVSPSSFLITPIWFHRTHHHWYWTPTDPSKEEANWMQISPQDSNRVIGGFWSGDTPASRNCVIIEYLKRHGDYYCF